MDTKSQFWFGFSISTSELVENRNRKFVKADKWQSIGDLVARECDLMLLDNYNFS